MKFIFSFIIPVFNRPQEIKELLESLIRQKYSNPFEVLVIEDGSTIPCKEVVENFEDRLSIQYIKKQNSGAGQSRNIGMQQANGNYFIILDSDVVLPDTYLDEVEKGLLHHFTDAFGGPDTVHNSFTNLQKAINYSMTSILTTGGIRGKKNSIGKFQPRSFNMGISKKAFETTNGYSKMNYGEDIDLTFRLWKEGFETQLLDQAFVYHKRRNTLMSFFKQTFNFGTARPILNKKYPKTAKFTYWLPSIFIIGFDISIVLLIFGYWHLFAFYLVYFLLILNNALQSTKNNKVALLAVATTFIQFSGYGLGFLKSTFRL